MEIYTLASSLGVSAPALVLALSALHRFGVAPSWAEAIFRKYSILASPVLFVAALGLFSFETLASKSKLTKPFKHAYDFLLTFAKPILALMFTVAMTQPVASVAVGTPVRFHEAAIGGWIFETLSTMSAADVFRLGIAIAIVMLVSGVRFVVEIVVWLTPLPFLDAAVSTVLDVYAVGMLCLVLFFPTAAVVACAAQLVVCVLLASWSFRVLSALVPLVLGRFRQPATSQEPAPPWVAEHAPAPTLSAWIEKCRPFGRFTHVRICAANSMLHVFGSLRFRKRHERLQLPQDGWVGIREGFLYDTVAISRGATLLFEVALPKTATFARNQFVAQLEGVGLPVHDSSGRDARLPIAMRAQVSS